MILREKTALAMIDKFWLDPEQAQKNQKYTLDNHGSLFNGEGMENVAEHDFSIIFEILDDRIQVYRESSLNTMQEATMQFLRDRFGVPIVGSNLVKSEGFERNGLGIEVKKETKEQLETKDKSVEISSLRENVAYKIMGNGNIETYNGGEIDDSCIVFKLDSL